MLGEGARTDADAQRYLEHYLGAVQALARGSDSIRAPEERDGISIKLSALFARYEDVQRSRVLNELVPRAWQLCEHAARAGINLTVDAEESERLELSLDVFEALATRIATNIAGGAVLALRSRLTRRVLSTRCLKSSLLQSLQTSADGAPRQRRGTGIARLSGHKCLGSKLTRSIRINIIPI